MDFVQIEGNKHLNWTEIVGDKGLSIFKRNPILSTNLTYEAEQEHLRVTLPIISNGWGNNYTG